MDQKLFSPKLCEEDIHQSKIWKLAKCQKNRVINSFPYMQKKYMFFIRNTTYLTICPKKYLFLTKKWSSFFRGPNFKNIYNFFLKKFMKV